MNQENSATFIEEKCIKIIQEAIQHDATDIHFVPNIRNYEVYMNYNRSLIRTHTLPMQLANRMVLYYKFLSALDISDKRKPQSGSFHKKMLNENYSFRVSSLPALGNHESIVIRIQKHNKILPLSQLCMNERWAEKLADAISQEQGLILVSGPTGSGKTTTMYAMTEHCVNVLKRHIISIEDPVENQQDHLLQIQVNERAGITYSTGLKAILRHSPDVIMVGEIRDRETAKIAVSAALSGHLVISTVHARNPLGTIYRMLDLGASLDELKQTLVSVSTQRLVMTRDQKLNAIFNIATEEKMDDLFNAVVRGDRKYDDHEAIEKIIQYYTD